MPVRLIAGCVLLYWAVFWLMNGLDKFLCGRDLVIFRWHGKDRTNQFGTYLQNIEIESSLVAPILTFAGVWEIMIGVVFAIALFHLIYQFRPATMFYGMTFGAVASVLTFIGFSAFDVVAGDRAELLEHGTYMMLLLISWLIVGRNQRAA